MIVFKITMNGMPEKQLEIKQTLLTMIAPTEKKPGCISFGVFCDIEDKNCFRLLGEWETREKLDHHIASPQFGVLLGTQALLCKPLETRIFTVFRSEGMDAVHSIRDHKKIK
jgi:quinol monooxygenase YgiN